MKLINKVLLLVLIICLGNTTSAQIYSTVSISTQNAKSSAEIGVRVFREILMEKTGIKVNLVGTKAGVDGLTIVFSLENEVPGISSLMLQEDRNLPAIGKEGFKIVSSLETDSIIILSNDERGFLFGAGYLLRKMELRKGQIRVSENLNVSSTPKYSIRGHQLGYRPKVNAYDAWTVQQFDEYIRDLAIFGNNSVEIMPPRTDDDFENSHMIMPAIKMIAEQSRIADKYDMDVWMWYPNMGTSDDFTDPEKIQKELKDRAEVFSVLPRLDDLFIPGGDPGDLEPDVLFNWMKKIAVVLHKYHPKAKIWVSPQVFKPSEDWYSKFYNEVNKKYDWFGGVVWGPWIKETIKEVRERVRADIPLRRYPDITHSLESQYPVPEWDYAFAATEGREVYNPRPLGEKYIHNLFARYAIGSISYSEGINDDVNKFIWSDQNWNPEIPAIETLRDYARLFIGPDYAEGVAQGFMSLEQNWQGHLLTNDMVQLTLQQWQQMEQSAPQEVMSNYRFQMGLLRAYYDAYQKQRLLFETNLEQEAKNILRQWNNLGPDYAADSAISLFKKGVASDVNPQLYHRIWALTDSVFRSIKSQLTAKPPILAKPGRGNFVDLIHVPLNDSKWIVSELNKVKSVESETEKGKIIDDMLQRTNPGPGNIYINLGSLHDTWKYVVRQKTWEEDPIGLESPFVDFGATLNSREWVDIKPLGFKNEPIPLAMTTYLATLYDTPLVLQFDDLNHSGQYKIKVTYSGRFNSHLRLMADNEYLIHDYIKTNDQPYYEFDIPKSATADGKLQLQWNCMPGERGTQVAEIWLINIQ